MKKAISVIMLIALIVLTFVSCEESHKAPPSPEIDVCEWNLIYGKPVGDSGYSTVYSTNDAPVKKDGAKSVNIKLLAKDGAVTLISTASDEVICTGKYVKDESGIYTITIADYKFTCMVLINEYVSWDTENTGFDGNKYGKYSLEMESSIYNMMFISDNSNENISRKDVSQFEG